MNFEDFDKYSKLLKVLGNPLRLKIVTALLEKKCRVGKLTDCVDEKLPIISQQLAVLRKAGIIKGIRNKNIINYQVEDEFVEGIIRLMRELQKN